MTNTEWKGYQKRTHPRKHDSEVSFPLKGQKNSDLALGSALMLLFLPVAWIHYYLLLAAPLAILPAWWVARRMHRDWDVRAHLTMESELWPHRTLACPGPVFIMGGRLSEATARGWRMLGGLHRRLLQRIAFVSAQDTGSATRYREAGLPEALRKNPIRRLALADFCQVLFGLNEFIYIE